MCENFRIIGLESTFLIFLPLTDLKRACEQFRVLRVSRISPFILRFAFYPHDSFKIEQHVRFVAFMDGPEP